MLVNASHLLILTTLLRLGVQRVLALKLEQKELLFVEKHLFLDSVAFQRFDNIHYVEALQQEVLALLHEELFPLRFGGNPCAACHGCGTRGSGSTS